MAGIPEVLFVCTHNAGRSQMAAALLDHQAAGRVRVTSAGSQPADQLNPAIGIGLEQVENELVAGAFVRHPKVKLPSQLQQNRVGKLMQPV